MNPAFEVGGHERRERYGRRRAGAERRSRALAWSLALAATAAVAAPQPPPATAGDALDSDVVMLSGRGPFDAVPWRFRCSEGRRCGEWTTIPVPSNWELHGFGRYDYGYRDDKRPESADYALRFRVPESWRGRRVELVFEGVMTDAAVTLNGHRLGSHRGGFTPFRFEVTEELAFEGENELAVRVDEASADASVNRAERDADYWVFGGIYRPVYLESHPPSWIRHLAVDARHGGHLRLRAEVAGAAGPVRLEADVRGLDGVPGGGRLQADGSAARPGAAIDLAGTIDGVVAWSAERPARYQLVVTLVADGRPVHRVRRTVGFRTVEVRRDGLFVNGRRVLLKGVNRHSFWPSTGRALDPEQNRRDAELIKHLNANAVRASHYPPDSAFLDAADALGLYVIDELPGWKEAYDTAAGRPLVAEMVRRDAHHPSIILWANGNEGGWNPALDRDFALHDLGARPVIHPEERFGGFDTVHYPTWHELRSRLVERRGWGALWGPRESDLVMPTEMLHGLYDGGGAAGLEAFWGLIRRSPRGAGGFLWALLDEGVVRLDQGGRIDTAGADAPDGIVSPWRDPEPSFAAVRRIWSPVALEEAQLLRRPVRGEQVAVRLRNRFDHTDLDACVFDYRWATLPGPPVGLEGGRAAAPTAPSSASPAAGRLPGPATAPGERGLLVLPAPAADADTLELEAFDPHGRSVARWSLPTVRRAVRIRRRLAELRAGSDTAETSLEELDDRYVLRSGEVHAAIDRRTGHLISFGRGERKVSLARGPRALGADEGTVFAAQTTRHANGVAVELGRGGGLIFVRWSIDRFGWLRMSYILEDRGRDPYVGVGLDLDLAAVETVTWLGRREPVWANRPFGSPLGIYRMRAGVDRGEDAWRAGAYAEVDWARFDGGGAPLVVAIEDDDLLLGIGTPSFAESSRTAVAEVPRSALSLLHRIAGIGTKFHRPRDLGPVAAPEPGLVNGALWMMIPATDEDPPSSAAHRAPLGMPGPTEGRRSRAR